jgi:hypothetical protein
MSVCDNPEPEPSNVPNKYNACHQDCCDRSFSQYSTISDVCNIDPETVAPNIYSDYQICMTTCDKPVPTLYDEAQDIVENLTTNITIVKTGGNELPANNATKTTSGTKTNTTTGTSGSAPLCGAPALAFLVILGLLAKK